MHKQPHLPFYDNTPVAITGVGWLLIISAVVVGFALLVAPVPGFAVFPANYVPVLLFTGLPLAALAFVTRGRLSALFHGYGLKAFGASLGFAVLTMLAPICVVLLLKPFLAFDANPSSHLLAETDAAGLSVFLSRTFIQLLGEELVTILPLLAVMWFCVQKLKLPKTLSLVIAIAVSTACFSALHLSTYNWNFVQCLVVIGSARLVLTASYLVTRNLWVSFVAHLINDWSIFVFVFARSHVPIGT